jgi:phage nucleotide-binding protein
MRITNTDDIGASALKILIYGPSGSGKTTLARTIKGKVLIVSAEAGLLSIAGTGIDSIDISLDDKGTLIPQEARIDRLKEVYKYLVSDEAKAKYDWVFVDSLTELGANMVAGLKREFPDRKDSLVMYGVNLDRMRNLIKLFRDLPHYNVAFTALDELDKDENGVRFHGISLTGKISALVPSLFDEVFYLSAVLDGDQIRRELVCQKTERLVTKDRSGALALREPCDLGLIANKILMHTNKGKKKEEKDVPIQQG